MCDTVVLKIIICHNLQTCIFSKETGWEHACISHVSTPAHVMSFGAKSQSALVNEILTSLVNQTAHSSISD